MTQPVAIPNFVYKALVVDVIDADTLRLNVDLGFRVSTIIEGRLNGVDAPELSTPEGKAARQAVVDLTHIMKQATVASFRNQRSFARWVVDVWLDDLSLADYLRTHNLIKTIPRIEDPKLTMQARREWYG